MAKICVIQPIQLYSGVIGLSKEQAEVRRHALTESGPGLYTIKAAVSFKAGEIIDARFPIPKSLRDSVESLSAAKKDG